LRSQHHASINRTILQLQLPPFLFLRKEVIDSDDFSSILAN
jgi:hypothetical protein